jgi:hypothetical protein
LPPNPVKLEDGKRPMDEPKADMEWREELQEEEEEEKEVRKVAPRPESGRAVRGQISRRGQAHRRGGAKLKSTFIDYGSSGGPF